MEHWLEDTEDDLMSLAQISEGFDNGPAERFSLLWFAWSQKKSAQELIDNILESLGL